LESKSLVFLVPSIAAKCRCSPWTLENEQKNVEKIGVGMLDSSRDLQANSAKIKRAAKDNLR
jgi:hypothetical protein